MLKQLYSIITYEEAVQTIDAGADHIGLVPMQDGGVPAHRVEHDLVDKIFDKCRERGVKTVAIMLNHDGQEIIDVCQRVKPDIVHFAGMDFTCDEDFATKVREACPGIEIMQAVLVDGPGALERAIEYSKFADWILTDTGLAPDTGIGASGETHDWDIDKAIVEAVDIPVIMAGGLGPDNVEEAIRHVRPAGVDSLSKTSIKYDGGHMEKDIEKVRLFCERADKAATELGL